jgi:hypothetical protein
LTDLQKDLTNYGCIDSNFTNHFRLIDKEARIPFTKKQSRIYRDCVIGAKKYYLLKQELKFITVTSSNESITRLSDPYTYQRQLTLDWKKLIQRIRRLTPYRLIKMEYLNKRQVGRFYGRNSLHKKVFANSHYLKVNTNEGNGVIHAISNMPYIPHQYIKDVWKELHAGSFNCNIQPLNKKKNSPSKVASYMATQYISSQDATYIRSSKSNHWIFKQSTSTINYLKKNLCYDYQNTYEHRCWDGYVRNLPSFDLNAYYELINGRVMELAKNDWDGVDIDT